MQIKTTIRYHLTPVRMDIINKSASNKCWRGCGKRGTLLYWWWECRLVQLLWKAVWRHLKKLKMDLPYDPTISLLEIYPKKPKTLIQKNISTPIALLFTIANIWKHPKCPSVHEWIKQPWDIYTREYYLAVKKEENVTLCDSMDGPGEQCNNWNKPVRERQTPYDFTHVESNEQAELTSKIDSERASWQLLNGGGGRLKVEASNKRKKNAWTWTTIWQLQGREGV